MKGRNINCMLGAMLAKCNFVNLELTLLLIFFKKNTSSRTLHHDDKNTLALKATLQKIRGKDQAFNTLMFN